jgi:hypothetical protein
MGTDKAPRINLDFTPSYQIVLAKIPRVACVFKVVMDADQRGRNRKLGDKCACTAKIFVNGKPYCVRHAQSVALSILINDRVAKLIEDQK